MNSLEWYAGLIDDPKRREIKAQIAHQRWFECQKAARAGPGPEWQVFWDADRIARFIREDPKTARRAQANEATRHELERRFKKMKKEDLSREILCVLLRSNYHIVRFRRGRSVVYRQGTPRRIADAGGERWEILFAKPPDSKSVH